MKKFTIEEGFSERIAKEDEFFSTKPYISYSGLNKLLYSPALYYKHYILKQRDDSNTTAAIEGKLIHCLLLTPDNFDKEYQIVSDSLPSENPKKVIDTIFEHYTILKEDGDEREDLIEFSSAILDVLADMNLYQSLKTDEQRITKIVDVPKHLDYWFYLKNCRGKILITQETYDFANGAVETALQSPVIRAALGLIIDNFNINIESYNEIELACELTDYTYNIRGILDNLIIDHDNKLIKINDFKTTSKDLTTFKESIDFYRYWMQVSFYVLLVKNSIYYKEDYKIEVRFLIIDCYQQVATMLVSDTTLSKWQDATKECFEKANYHLANRIFDLPYEFAQCEGELII
jgi:hypothetical protein